MRLDVATLTGRLLFILAVAFVVFIVCAWAAGAQEADSPPGSPYRVGPTDSSSVSLRDFMSSRIDHLSEIVDERDRQYAQRFEAQQQALSAALESAKEAVANALQASKEAVLKAEDAANKRFDSVNEFRQTLTDQADTFMGKAEADARLNAVEKSISDIRSRGEGANNLWIILGGLLVLAVSLASLALNLKRKEQS